MSFCFRLSIFDRLLSPSLLFGEDHRGRTALEGLLFLVAKERERERGREGESKKERERGRERGLLSHSLAQTPPSKNSSQKKSGPPPRRPGPRLLPDHPGRAPPLLAPPRAYGQVRRPGAAPRLRRQDGLRPARRLGDRGRDRQRVQDRRLLFVAQCQHGVEA